MEEQSTKTWAIDPVHTKIRFEAKYLMVTAISGWFREFEGTVTSRLDDFSDSNITLTIYTNSLFTGIDERDNHLRSPDFFDTKKYPTIQFKSVTTTAVDDSAIYITGQLAIKDIVQPIQFTARHLGNVPDPMGNTKACFEMDAVFDRKDFNISWNQFFDQQGVLISDQVKLHADIQLLKMS